MHPLMIMKVASSLALCSCGYFVLHIHWALRIIRYITSYSYRWWRCVSSLCQRVGRWHGLCSSWILKKRKKDQTENEQFNSLLLRVVSPRVACSVSSASRAARVFRSLPSFSPKLATSHNLCTLWKSEGSQKRIKNTPRFDVLRRHNQVGKKTVRIIYKYMGNNRSFRKMVKNIFYKLNKESFTDGVTLSVKAGPQFWWTAFRKPVRQANFPWHFLRTRYWFSLKRFLSACTLKAVYL